MFVNIEKSEIQYSIEDKKYKQLEQPLHTQLMFVNIGKSEIQYSIEGKKYKQLEQPLHTQLMFSHIKKDLDSCYNCIKNKYYTELAIISHEKITQGLLLLSSIESLSKPLLDYFSGLSYNSFKINHNLQEFLKHMHTLRRLLYKNIVEKAETKEKFFKDLQKFKTARDNILENITLFKEFLDNDLFILTIEEYFKPNGWYFITKKNLYPELHFRIKKCVNNTTNTLDTLDTLD